MLTDWEKWLLVLVLYREGRGEGDEGMTAIGHVIRNRMEKWGKTLSEVVLGKFQFSSMTVRGDSQTVVWPGDGDFPRISELVELIFKDSDVTNGALYYANVDTITSDWFRRQIINQPKFHPVTAKIGHHTFFG